LKHSLDPLDVYVRHTSKFINPILRRFAALARTHADDKTLPKSPLEVVERNEQRTARESVDRQRPIVGVQPRYTEVAERDRRNPKMTICNFRHALRIAFVRMTLLISIVLQSIRRGGP